jgi:hypothetical protein
MNVPHARRQGGPQVLGSAKRRAVATALAGAALALTTGSAAATTPTVETWTNHVEVGFFDCDGFSVIGRWAIHHRLTFYYDAEGVAVRDIERIDYSGELVNSESGASLPDGGIRVFFDTLAPDGSYLTTYMVQVRDGTYLHTAGRIDFQDGTFRGIDGLQPDNFADVCEALSD